MIGVVNQSPNSWLAGVWPCCLGLALAAPAFCGELQPGPALDRWPSFRGVNAAGCAERPLAVSTWNAATGHNLLWKTAIPGLGHSCPVIWDGQIFITTAISGDPKAELKTGRNGGAGQSATDDSKHTWRVYCLDFHSGKVRWEATACAGVPKVKRHPKSTQANATPATDGKRLVVFFASEGLYCYDLDGKLLWQKDLGVIDAGAFDNVALQWGSASSPIIFQDMVLVQCDQQQGSFLAAFELASGKEIWRDKRQEGPSWSTPVILQGKGRAELITASPNFSRGYDPRTGKELWRLGNHSSITVPTPVVGKELIYLADGYSRPGPKPIYAVRPGQSGDISLAQGTESSDAIAWSRTRGGPYVPTPILVGDLLYVCNNIGVLACYDGRTGKQLYEQRLGGNYSASPIAAAGRIYFTSEEGDVRVIEAGPEFKPLATNPIGEPCLATPALASGRLIVRTASALLAIGVADVKEDKQKGDKPKEDKQKGDKPKEDKQKAIEAEWKLRNGLWEPVSAVVDGKERPAGKDRKMVLEYKDETYRDKVGDKIVGEGISRVDPTQTPKALDIIPQRNGVKGQTALAIYELKGDELIVCLARPGKDRPKEFESKPDSGHVLLKFKRVKP
jgi:uncharacterized protein (TIGR03067 family)